MIRSTTVSRRYAAAYFVLAQEANDIVGWRDGLRRAVETVSHPDVGAVLNNPQVARQQRIAWALQLLDGVPQPARNCIHLLLERGRLAAISSLLNEYDELADRASGRVRARVITAIDIDEAHRGEIERTLQRTFGANVDIALERDPDIIGGLIIKVGDRVIDGSVRTKLQQLQAQLA